MEKKRTKIHQFKVSKLQGQQLLQNPHASKVDMTTRCHLQPSCPRIDSQRSISIREIARGFPKTNME